jgi:uncharacterized protein YbaA (DUF1428 family)
MKYVDGYVLAVPKKNLQAYRRMAQMAGKVWRKHGALDYKECVGDDLKTKWGTPFSRIWHFLVFDDRNRLRYLSQ